LPVKWNSGKVIDEYEKKQHNFLIGAGHIMVNQMADLTHVISGLLKNSIIFRLKTGERSEYGTEEEGRPTAEDEVSKPDDPDFVRTGSNVVYAGAYEKNTGTFSQAIDQVISDKSLVKLAEKIFK
jgi:hypothetical protein